MARVKRGVTSHAKHKKVLKAAKGFWGARSKLHKVLKENLHRAWAYAYKGRRLKKRDFRSLWITRLNAAARARGLRYSQLIQGLNKAGIAINRKILSELAIHDPKGFDAVFDSAKRALEAK